MVKTLVEPIHNTSRKFTCDRYFTAVELFEHLLNLKLTSVGTVMPNRKHFPIALTTKGNREINSTLFAVKDSVTMCSWVQKKGKLVLLLSTLHQTKEIAKSEKPEIIEFDNQTKAGVDALDQKVRHYSTYRKTKCCLKLFFTIFLTLLPTMHLFYSSYSHQRNVLILNKEHVRSFFQCLEKLLSNPTLLPDHGLL